MRALPLSTPLVVACRPDEFEASGEELAISKIFELHPLTDEQIITLKGSTWRISVSVG
jgi:predicted NACHT family NTPase